MLRQDAAGTAAGGGDDGDEAAPSANGEEETSLEELATRSKRREDAEEDPDETSVVPEREDRVAGSLSTKVTPQQDSEFVCRSCFLIKHQSQLANKKRSLCRDCA